MIAGTRDLGWTGAILGTLAIILIINPVGFVGGGWDDWQYLNAARCWVEHGPCLPRDHWQGRWPIVAPLAAVMAVFGESRLTVGLPSLAYSLCCLALLSWLGNRLAARPSGYIAALLLLVAPAFAIGLLDPTVEAAELFFLLAAACFTALFAERRGLWLAFAAALSLGLAFQVRETALAAAPLAMVGAWLLARNDRSAWLAAIAGALLPLIVETVIFWVAAGDPMWRRNLSLAHTQIPSSELLHQAGDGRSPLFNPAYIANWRHEPGIQLHWLVDGLVNLIVNAKAGMTIAAATLLFAIFGRNLLPRDRKLVVWCLGIALYWACFLIYFLAIDPKPRMMMVPIVLTAIGFAVLLRDRWNRSSALIAPAIAATVFSTGLLMTFAQPEVASSEAIVEQWAKRHPGQIETDETTRRHLTLSRAASDFADLSSERPYLVLRLATRCSVWADEDMNGAVVVLERSAMSLIDPRGIKKVNNFCLFRYLRPISPEIIEQSDRVVAS